MDSEILRLVDGLHRDKDIDAEIVFQGIEAALLSAARKHYGDEDTLTIHIDRETGSIIARDGDREIHPTELGRIAAQTAKQVMIQKIREAERDAIAEEYGQRVMSIIGGSVQCFEGPNIIANLGRTEGFLPRSEQIPAEVYHVGERIRAIILEVKPVGTKVRVVLSRSHPELVRRLFEVEVPEVAEGIIEIKGIAREAGCRTKIAVTSHDPRVDCVGACVGVQGSRIRSIVDELNGEKIDIVRWNASTQVLIGNALRPAEIDTIELSAEGQRALVVVPEDQLSLAIGKRGQNVRLASKLTGWDIDIKSHDVVVAEPRGEEADADAPAEAADSQPPPATDVAEEKPSQEPSEPEADADAPAEAADSQPPPATDVAEEKPSQEPSEPEADADALAAPAAAEATDPPHQDSRTEEDVAENADAGDDHTE